MISPSKFKSRTFRRVKKVTPGHNNVTHYVKRKPGVARCPVYGTPLSGVPRARPSEMKKIPRTARRPERPFGGVLSPKASREYIKEMARLDEEE
ncbi:MAG: 50S ribosomal protein L34e [Candidatus Woesearchaeota archaeon]